MTKTKVLLINEYSKSQIKYFKEKLSEFDFVVPKNFDEDELLKHISDAKILLGDRVTRAMLEKGNIEFIQVPQAGVENLDFELLLEYNIPAYNSHSNALSVAEYAVALLLGISKKIPYHDSLLRLGDWNKGIKNDKNNETLYSSYVSNKTIGIIGYGNIGKNIGKLLKGFNPKIMAIVSDKTKKYDSVDFLGDLGDLDHLLESSDYVIVATALTDKTKGILNKEKLTKMKRTAYLINVSRGKIIDEDALYYILKNRLIAGAGIDTWYEYPKKGKKIVCPSKKYEFNKLSNIIMSPHRAAEIDGEFTYFDDAIYNIKQYHREKNYKNKINIKKGY